MSPKGRPGGNAQRDNPEERERLPQIRNPASLQGEKSAGPVSNVVRLSSSSQFPDSVPRAETALHPGAVTVRREPHGLRSKRREVVSRSGHRLLTHDRRAEAQVA
jgi:hypothetical protein